jgi:hypothetical protein
MPTTMKIGEIHSNLVLINQLDQLATDLSAKARIANAVNINNLKPHALSYEKLRGEAWSKIAGDNWDPNTASFKETAAITADEARQIAAVDAELRGAEIEVPTLKQFTVEDLRLDANPKISSNFLVMLQPFLSDYAEVIGGEAPADVNVPSPAVTKPKGKKG